MQNLMYHGTFLTMDEKIPEPEAVLVEGGRIAAVGDFEELRRQAPGASLQDMGGHTVLPGFVDGHSHITAVAYQLLIANLKPSPTGNCDSVAAVVAELKRFLAEHTLKPGQWLIGMGYDNSAYPDGRIPTKEDLDEVSREIPIAATHISGHLCVVNSRGLELLGYTGENFEVPEGGEVEPSGLLKEQAFLSVNGRMKGPEPEEVTAAVGEASRLYASRGFTTVHDGKVRREEYGLLKAASDQGLLCTDVVVYFTPETAAKLLPAGEPAENLYENHLRKAGVKLFLDGSPQGKTAWLSAPYFQPPEGASADYRGFPVQTEAGVLSVMRRCAANHWQINVHANGDEAIEQMIRCYAKTLEETGCREDMRPVVIHCQMVREDQLERMKNIHMLASFFADHVYYWGDYHYESVLGPERAERISPLRSALEHGISFTLHQDSPVVPPDAVQAVHNAVNRVTRKGRVLGGDQRVSTWEALRAVTINGAYQIFEERRKGSITPGKLADFVVLDRNPLLTEAEKLREIKVLQTIKEGNVIFQS